MKKYLTLFLLVMAGMAVQAQSKFDGYWLGTVETSDDDEATFVIRIDNGQAMQMHYVKGKGLQPSTAVKHTTTSLRNNLSYTWQNQGGAWSETQTFMLSFLSPEKLRVIWVRQVNNLREGQENEEWNILGLGDLVKLDEDDLKELSN